MLEVNIVRGCYVDLLSKSNVTWRLIPVFVNRFQNLTFKCHFSLHRIKKAYVYISRKLNAIGSLMCVKIHTREPISYSSHLIYKMAFKLLIKHLQKNVLFHFISLQNSLRNKITEKIRLNASSLRGKTASWSVSTSLLLSGDWRWSSPVFTIIVSSRLCV